MFRSFFMYDASSLMTRITNLKSLTLADIISLFLSILFCDFIVWFLKKKKLIWWFSSISFYIRSSWSHDMNHKFCRWIRIDISLITQTTYLLSYIKLFFFLFLFNFVRFFFQLIINCFLFYRFSIFINFFI